MPPWHHFLPSRAELLQAIRQTERGDEAVLEILSWPVFFAAVLITTLALLSFQLIIELILVPASIANGYAGDAPGSDLKILDLRAGYSAPEVAQLLAWWGSVGRLAYIIIEIIDLFVYHVGYRLAFVVLFNNMVTTAIKQYPTYARILKWCPRIPLYLAKIDMIEDACQIAIVCLYEYQGDGSAHLVQQDYFNKLVRISSGINLLKWGFMKCGCMVFLYLWTIVRIGGAISKTEKQGKSS